VVSKFSCPPSIWPSFDYREAVYIPEGKSIASFAAAGLSRSLAKYSRELSSGGALLILLAPMQNLKGLDELLPAWTLPVTLLYRTRRNLLWLAVS
jgi:hypothetical protein